MKLKSELVIIAASSNSDRVSGMFVRKRSSTSPFHASACSKATRLSSATPQIQTSEETASLRALPRAVIPLGRVVPQAEILLAGRWAVSSDDFNASMWFNHLSLKDPDGLSPIPHLNQIAT